MSKVNLNSCAGVDTEVICGAFGTHPYGAVACVTPKHTPTKEKVIKPRYISVPHPTDPDTTILERVYTPSPASSFDDSVLDPDYTPTPVVRDDRYL